MSVYTKITEDELSKHLLGYSIGKAISLTGISDGIENTNYLLKTDQNEFIFTIFEIAISIVCCTDGTSR